MKPNNNQQQPQNEYQKILKKIQSQSKQKKHQRTLNILRGQNAKNKSYQPINLLATFKKYLQQKQLQTFRHLRKKQTKHTTIITCFLIFSSYLCWMVQKKYDIIRKKAQRTQTYKERQVQKENQYIERMLRKKEFESVPIPNELEEENTYKFQQDKQTRGGFVIDTKQDLMDLIEKDKNPNKKTPSQIYQEELNRNTERI